MLLVDPPDKAGLIRILEGLLEGKHSRDEVVSWWNAVQGDYGDGNQDTEGVFWYLQSLSALTIPISLGDGEPYFIRERDIEEYLLDLRRVPANETFEGIARVRSHQTDPEAVRWPLVMMDQSDIHRLERLGLPSVRGLFDAHLDLVEHTHLLFQGDLYLIVRQYDNLAHQVMILGTRRDPAQLRQFVDILGFAG